MNTLDDKYLNLLDHVMTHGKVKKDRTGVGTRSVFGYDMRIDLSEGLSLLTTKYVHYPAVIHELLWFLMGGTDIKYLLDNNVNIWTAWPFKRYEQTALDQLADTDCISGPGRVRRHFNMEEYVYAIKSVKGFAERHGQVGKVYGAQWVNWTWPKLIDNGGIDAEHALSRIISGLPVGEYHIAGYNQISKLIDALKNNPDSRRMLVTAWNPPEMDACALPCCHYGFQCYTDELTVEERVRLYAAREGQTYEEFKTNWDTDKQWSDDCDLNGVPKRRLSLKFNIRSLDVFLGEPFDIASYSILTHMLCAQLNMVPGELIQTIGDTHIYLNHVEQVKLQLSRTPYANLPQLLLRPSIDDIFKYKYDDIAVVNYTYHPAIKAPIAV